MFCFKKKKQTILLKKKINIKKKPKLNKIYKIKYNIKFLFVKNKNYN